MRICKEKFALVFSKNHEIAHDVFNTDLFEDVMCGTGGAGIEDVDAASINIVINNVKQVYEMMQDQELEGICIIFDKHYEHILDKLPKSPVIGGLALCKWDVKNKRPIKVGYL